MTRHKSFLEAVASHLCSPSQVGLTVITHILWDRRVFLNVLRGLWEVDLIVPIPYSVNRETMEDLHGDGFQFVELGLEPMMNGGALAESVSSVRRSEVSRLFLDIGGYWSRCLTSGFFRDALGFVEDTESGHRQYGAVLEGLPQCVYSVARSPLKVPEDLLVGASCVFSVEKELRRRGTVLQSRQVLVLGYGKVGKGVAHALRGRGCHTLVYDVDPIRRLEALAEGFQVPERRDAISSASIIFGASGSTSLGAQDVELIESGALLASCSSKRVEFEPLVTLDETDLDSSKFEVLAGGTPVNFMDGAEIGPLLYLTQAEIMVSVQNVVRSGGTRQSLITGVSAREREAIAEIWLEHYCDSRTGTYVFEPDV